MNNSSLVKKIKDEVSQFTRAFKFALDNKGFVDVLEYNLKDTDRWDYSVETAGIETYLQTYKKLLWVFRGIYERASQGSSVPFKLWERTSPHERKHNVIHPVNDLLENPNNLLTRSELFHRVHAFELLAGDCIWFIEREDNGLPKKLHVPIPSTVEIRKYNRTDQREYKYNGDWRHMKDVIHFKTFNPVSVKSGMSAVSPLEETTVLELYETMYGQSFFENAVRPSMLFKSSSGISEAQYERFLAAMRRIHQGVQKMHNIDLIEGDIEPMTIEMQNPADGDFISIKELNRSDILGGLGCYHLVAMYESASNIQEYKRMFWESILPELTRIQETLTKELIRQYPRSENLYGEFDIRQVSGLRPSLLEESLAYYRLNQAGAYTANDIRDKLGEDGKVPWGDRPPASVPKARTSHVSNEERETMEQNIPHPEQYVDTLADNIAEKMKSENGDLSKDIARSIVLDELQNVTKDMRWNL